MRKSNKLLILSVALLSVLASCGGTTNKEDPTPVDQVESFITLGQGTYQKEAFVEESELDLAKIKEIEEGKSEFTLTLNEVDENFLDPLIYETLNTKLDLYNLKLGSHYYYKVEAKAGSKIFSSNTYSFTTIDTPIRSLYIEGVVNARDLGGWTTTSGKKVKQGLVYRSGRLNKNRMNIVQRQITNECMRVMNEDLKMKSEIDLRQRENNEVGSLKASVLCKHINYYNTPMKFDFDELNNTVKLKGMIKEVFTVFSEPTNLPAFFHCSIGTDRTGMIAYMLNGLLGVAKEDLLKDYMFSNFGGINDTRDTAHIKTNYVKYLDEYRGETLEQKIANYLLDIGITQEQIDSIRNTMLEK